MSQVNKVKSKLSHSKTSSCIQKKGNSNFHFSISNFVVVVLLPQPLIRNDGKHGSENVIESRNHPVNMGAKNVIESQSE